MGRLTQSAGFSYLVAIAVTAAAALVRWLLDPWLGIHLPYITFFIAIVAAGWKGGWRPAALSAALGFLISLYLFVPPWHAFGGETGPFLIGVALYVVASLMIVAIVEGMHAVQRRLRKQERLLQTTLSSIGDAVVASDSAGNVSFLNPVAEELTGWSRADAAGLPMPQVLPMVNAKTRQPEEDPLAKVLRLGPEACRSNHGVLMARDGTERPIEASAAPIRDERGVASGVVLVFRDVSARRRAEIERQEAQDQVISTLESIPDAFLRLNREWRFVYVNGEYERRFARRRDSQIGKLLWEEWPHLRGTRVETELRRAMAERRTAEFESYHAPWDRWYALKICPIVNGDLAIFVQDVTDRKKAEKALRTSEQRFRLAAEAVNGIIYDHDPVTGKVERTQGLSEVLGYRPEDVPPTAQWWLEQLHPDDRRELEARHTSGIPPGAERELNIYRVRHKDGRYLYIADRSLAVRDEKGRLVRQVGCSIDITAIKDAESRLKEADRRKDEFLATLAHELRNPLAPISNAVQYLKARCAPDPAITWGVGVIDRQVQTMARLLDDLLDVSRISRNKLVLRRERVKLGDVIRQAVETSRPLIDIGGHELTIALPPEPVELDGDPVRLAQVLSNLLSNAAKYTPGGGHIRLAAAREDGYVAVSVQDDGIGIESGMLPHLFQIFSQAEPALERAQGGLGIGLSLVSRLVELHGGSIEAHSEGAGRGSEFIVRLPLPQRQGAPEAGAAGKSARTSRPARCSILVADDNRDGADTMAMLLESMGHEVCTAYDGEQALAEAERLHPDVALLDVGMPKRNGYEVCREIRRRPWGKDMILIAVTGWGQEEDRRRAREAGFDHHLVKPVDPASLSVLLPSAQPGN